MGVTRARIAQAETAETSGGVTLKTMQTLAEAMGCRFVYAVLPPKGKETEDVIFAQAMKQARAIVERTDVHMALEGQGLSKEKLEHEVQRLARYIAGEMAPGFWNDL
jgi:predicted DNA-binding mobile mystery protein A